MGVQCQLVIAPYYTWNTTSTRLSLSSNPSKPRSLIALEVPHARADDGTVMRGPTLWKDRDTAPILSQQSGLPLIQCRRKVADPNLEHCRLKQNEVSAPGTTKAELTALVTTKKSANDMSSAGIDLRSDIFIRCTEKRKGENVLP